MRGKLILAVTVLAIVSIPALAIGASFEGSIQGFTCVTQGKVCPVGKEDPMAAAERVFVLHTGGDKYYFVPNVDRAILARHLNEMIRIDGSLSSRHKAIKATDIYVKGKRGWKKTWSKNMEDEIYRDVHGLFPHEVR